MQKLELFTQTGCVPCRWLEKVIHEKGLEDKIQIRNDAYHALAHKKPTLIIDSTSAVVGVVAIEKYIETYLK